MLIRYEYMKYSLPPFFFNSLLSLPLISRVSQVTFSSPILLLCISLPVTVKIFPGQQHIQELVQSKAWLVSFMYFFYIDFSLKLSGFRLLLFTLMFWGREEACCLAVLHQWKHSYSCALTHKRSNMCILVCMTQRYGCPCN